MSDREVSILPQDEITEAAQDALCQHIVEYSAATTYTVPESAFVHARILFRRGVEWERERKQQSKGSFKCWHCKTVNVIRQSERPATEWERASGEQWRDTTREVLTEEIIEREASLLFETFANGGGLSWEKDTVPGGSDRKTWIDMTRWLLVRAKNSGTQQAFRSEITDEMVERACQRHFDARHPGIVCAWTTFFRTLQDTKDRRAAMRDALEAALTHA